MSDRRVEDHIKQLLRDAAKAAQRGDVDKLIDIAQALYRVGDAEAAKAVENRARRLAAEWAVTN